MAIGEFGGAPVAPGGGGVLLSTPLYWLYEMSYAALNPARAWADATRLFFNAFPVDRKGLRNRKGLAGLLLSEDVPLLLFPEGTRSRTGAMKGFTPGHAALSISRNVPVLPIALVGAYAAMPYGASISANAR